MAALEREFGATDSAARAIGSDGLPTLLLLLATERWLPTDRLDRRAQLQVLGALAEWMLAPRSGRFGSYCGAHVNAEFPPPPGDSPAGIGR